MQTYSHGTIVTAALGASASLIALAWGQPAVAQQSGQSDQPAASSSGLEEIVVTARRKEEKAQSVPIALINVNANVIAAQEITQTADLMKITPGFTVCCGHATNTYAWMRGVPGVVGYFADAPVSLGSQSVYFDIGNLQVLKGPQGTLFGIATDGGALVYQPKMPTNSFEGYVDAEVGDYGHYKLQGVVNIPVIDDKLLVRIGGEKNHTDGYIYDLSNKNYTGDENFIVGRIIVTYRPTDDIQNDLHINHSDYWDAGGAAINVRGNPALYASLFPGVNPNQYSSFFGPNPLGWYATYGTAFPGGFPTKVSQWNIIDTARWDVSDTITLKNIAAYQEIIPGSVGGDSDQTPLPFITTALTPPFPISRPSGPAVQASDEVQLLGKLFGDRISYTIGTFNFFSQSQLSPHNNSYTTAFGGTSGSNSYTVDRTNAVYGQGTYDLGEFIEGLSFTGGYRYTWDRLSQHASGFGPTGLQVTDKSLAAQFHSPSYTLSLDYQITSQTLLYVTDSKGYSHGGFNPGAQLPPGYQQFQPESLDNVEVGIKSDWDLPWEMKARTNVSFFYGFYDNIQVPANTFVPSPTGGVSIQTITQNAAQGHIEGIDSEFTLIPSESVELHGNVAYTLDKYDNYADPATGLDKSGLPFLYAPKWKYSISGTYHLPVDESLGQVSVTANFAYISPNLISIQFPATPDDFNPKTHVLDLSADWKDFLGRTGLDARLFGTNILQNHHSPGTGAAPLGFGNQVVFVAPPREWGVSVRYAFGP